MLVTLVERLYFELKIQTLLETLNSPIPIYSMRFAGWAWIGMKAQKLEVHMGHIANLSAWIYIGKLLTSY
jgi:hypothetical protein